MTLRKVIKTRGSFPNEEAAIKLPTSRFSGETASLSARGNYNANQRLHNSLDTTRNTPVSAFGKPSGHRLDETLIVHTILNFLFLLISIIYRPESLNHARPNAIRRNGDYSCAYPTKTQRSIRLRRLPPHRRTRHPLHCPRRTRLHHRSRPIL